MKIFLRRFLVAALALPFSLFAQAPPANDNFANAFTLTGTVVTTNGNSGQAQAGVPNATKEPGEPNHANLPGGRSVWFNWTAPTNIQVRIDTIGSAFNTLLGVYLGNAVNALSLVVSNDNITEGFGGNNASRVEFSASAGTTYRIAVDGRGGGGGQNPASGPYVLNLRGLASVFITSPTNNTVISPGTPIPIRVAADVPTPPVARVNFYRAGELLGSDTTAPYEFTLGAPSPGTNRLFAVATDSGGINWTSPVVNVAVLGVGVNLVAPEDGATFVNTNPITVSALGLLPAGQLASVEFFVDGAKFGEDDTAPFSATWTNVTSGAHRFTATARDGAGNTYRSAPINVGVARLLIARGSVWRFLDNGSDQGTNWTGRFFDDDAWKSGPGELGYGDGDEATVVASGPAGMFFTTTYFRHAFNVTGAAGIASLVMNVKRDDGCVVFINGVEVTRFNMNAGPVLFNTLAPNAADDGANFLPATVSAGALVNGLNLIAVEMHQSGPTSTDISFEMDMAAVPVVIRNQSPMVEITTPANGTSFRAPPSVSINATASDSDGNVAKVEFFVDGLKIGEDTTSPYSAVWNNPPLGPHVLTAVGTDEQGGSGQSETVRVVVYDALGTPFAAITSPADGAVMEGPTNLLVTAFASALDGVAQVEFFANGAPIGTDDAEPYAVTWAAPFGDNTLRAVSVDFGGARGTSVVSNVRITIPPTNTVAPRIATQLPLGNATVTNLTNITVTFTERVQGVDAADLLVNGARAAQVVALPGGSNYVFSFAQPAYGEVGITFASGHGITDFGFPSNLPFNERAAGSAWSYVLVDRTPPTVAARVPTAGATVTNLTQVSVTFSELVNGVEATDFLVNNVPATSVSGNGANYTFTFQQPGPGTVNIAWSTEHGITDRAESPNAFNATGAGATWTYTLDNRTVLVQSNSTWLFIKGTAEASTPIDEWRKLTFDDANWSNSLAPFFFGDPYTNAANPGTLLSDMQGNYTSIYLRRRFDVLNAAVITNLLFNVQIDDGFVAYINGVEVARFNLPAGDVPYNGVATATAQEPTQTGAAYVIYNLPNPAGYLRDGGNVLSVHAFNQSLAQSTDFGFNAQLYTFIPDLGAVAPIIASVTPATGDIFALNQITVRFSEGVSGVNAGDLLINGTPATSVSSTTNTTYVFSFAQPPFGQVNVTWANNHGIADFDTPPKPFNATAAGATFRYSLVNPSAPTVASQSPLAGATINQLTSLRVTFSEAVTGVDAADLRVAGAPATGVSGGPTIYNFTFPQPPYGAVAIGWAANHGITDVEAARNAFDGTRAGNTWAYTLVDQTPPTIASLNPPAGSQVTNLTQVVVTFSEAVTGVNATDLRISGAVATSLSGSGATYTFGFAQANATVLNFTWANNHGIRDLAPVPNSFDASAPGANWTYITPDTLAPVAREIVPAPFVTLRSLNSIRVTFAEPVRGVGGGDLLINGRAALSVSGSGAGPYTFSFLPASNGVVNVAWIANHGITDLATPANAFAGGAWNYTIDPNATFAGKVLIDEIMFNPLGGRPAEEWLELRNVTATPINLAGWRFTRGVNFTFPNVSISGNGYLVVAANPDAFREANPGAEDIVGGWTGSLANSDETLELETALGEIVNTVHYATEGDWARRERGHGAELVESITRNGNTATVRIFNHGYTSGGGFGGGVPDVIQISGADQPEYDGLFTIAGATASTFNITVTGTPASPATGRILSRHAVDEGASGWSWFSEADGFGMSVELRNPALGNASGQNWGTSTNVGGTPGRPNSVAAANVPPLILDATHFPPVPKSTDTVAITARVRDEAANGVASVRLFYRDHTTTTPGAFVSTNLFDDGAHSDGVRGDGLFGAVLPAATNGTIIEFYLQATDTSGLSRTWPAPTRDTNNTFAQLANALYQVDDESITNLMQALRIVMTGSERAVFPPQNRNSDAEANVTFISADGDGTRLRYLSGVRVRGAGSRTRTPPNNRVNIPNDNRWNGLAAINLNGQYVHSQIMGAAVSRKAGLAASDAHLIQYRINGVNPAPLTAPGGGNNGAGYGTFILVQPVNGDLAAELYPQDPDGNVYRASIGTHAAQLNSRGTNIDQYVTDGYFKTSNQTENDWTDLVNLTFAFSQTAAPLADYNQAISTNVNVEAWMRYFAVGTLVNFGETSMFNGRGDDYALYRGTKDPRFVAIGHDYDTIFGQGDTTGTFTTSTNSSIYIMLNPPNSAGQTPNMPLLRRFLDNEEFSPIFFRELKRLADTVFSPEQLNPLFDQMLTGWGNGPTTVTIDAMKTHAANRRAVVLSQIPLSLTVSNTLSVSNGFFFSPTRGAVLFGTSHAIDTRRVLVNGVAAERSPWEARWTNTVTLQSGINRVLVQSLDSNHVEFARSTMDIWYDDGSVANVSGAIASDTTWTAAGGPYLVTANLTVNAGVTLTIQAGASVYFGAGVDLVVANGGRLLAEGTDTARIRLGAAPGGANWGGITINGGPDSPESRIAFTHIDGNGDPAIEVADGTVFLDSLTFGNTARQYVSLDRASFVVQNCVFPAITAGFEPVHGTGGIKAGGRGIVRRNFWGKIQGYNDAFDFTGGNRPGPILQVINNVFMGSDDDLLDLDSTDAWVEGNIFLHTHRVGSPDSASAVSGGSDNADNSQITIIGNLFYDVDHAANAKQTNFYTMINNTVVHQTKIGSQDTNTAVVILADDTTSQGLGFYLEGNIIYDAENLTRNVTTALVTYTNNLLFQYTGAPWTGPGGGNVTADPLLKRIPPFSETTNYTSWAQAQVMWDHFSLRPGSPALGAGPNGRDLGAVQRSTPLAPLGVSISGEPAGVTPLTTATLRVDPLRTGNGIPVNGFPNGSGFTHYRWRLDGGPWSAETPTAMPINLSGLANGFHQVEVVGRNDAGFYQDDPVFGPDATITVSRGWNVNTSGSSLRLNEILASNGGAVVHQGTTPDIIELHNASDAPVNLAGVRLTDDINNPDKFIFPAGASIGPRGCLVVYADNPNGTPGIHLGFGLSASGGEVHLYAAAANGGALIDALGYGPQITDLSVGVMDSLFVQNTARSLQGHAWTLTQPTPGAANRAARIGDARSLRINEWLALGLAPISTDFVELYNRDALPVALGGLYISDELVGWPTRHLFRQLSFIAGGAYLRFIADGDANAGGDHLSFNLNGDKGSLAIYLPDLAVVDCVWYAPQQLNVSMGRSPNGSTNIVVFDTPTPGAPNPIISGPAPFGGALVINEVLADNASLVELNGRTPDWVELYNGTTGAIDLSDLSLSDSASLRRKFVFAAGTTIAAGGYLRILSDGSQPSTTNSQPPLNTGFGLSGKGGAVYLFDKPSSGGTLINSIVYGVQTPNLSIGRVPSGGTNWTLNTPTPNAANNAVATLGNAANLRVNEWMADPAAGDDWFEIYNPNALPVALGGLHLTDDLNARTKHRIAPLSFIGNGTNAFLQFHADGNTGAGADHTSFSLRAAGEAVGISTASGALIDGVTFGQQVVGVSQGRFSDGGTNIVSFPGTDSPGAPNWRLLTDIVISEVLTHTDLPLEDAIELRNVGTQSVDVGGWWLSDDDRTLQKYQIPAPRVIPPGGFTVIYENVFTNREIAAVPFALSSRGDEVVLSAYANNALTGFRARVDFGPAANGVSFGRYVTSDNRAEFVAMTARTFGFDDPANVEQFRTGTGAANSLPRVGPVVITEVMYHPPDLGTNDNGRDEFIELRNISTAPVNLFDSTNAWHLRDAVDFDFPIGTVMQPGDMLLVVGFDPVNNTAALAEFRARYNLVNGVNIVGPWSGKLANDTDDIELRRPDVPDTNGVAYILVERVRYADAAPWPAQADGTGFSLHRMTENEFANDPANWFAAAPTPGPAGTGTDTDGDGLPDAWETQYGLDPFNPLDAALDTDGDGLTNLQEFQLGTDPRNAASGTFLRITRSPGTRSVDLTFFAAANVSYAIESTTAFGTPWVTFQSFAAADTGGLRRLSFLATTPVRFFRLRAESSGTGNGLRINSIRALPGNQSQLTLSLPDSRSCTLLYAPALTGPWSEMSSYPAGAARVLPVTVPAPGGAGFFRLRTP